jgi:hypothetical protein
MTVTDEDRKAARAVWIQAAFDYGGQSIPGEGEERAARVIADFIADTRQAAYAAGLERAAVILEEDAKLCDCFARAEGECACGAWDDYKTAPIERMVDLIRAEKDKP